MVPGRAGASGISHDAIGLGAPTVTGDTLGMKDPNAIAEYNTNPPARTTFEKKADWAAHDTAEKAKQEAAHASNTSASSSSSSSSTSANSGTSGGFLSSIFGSKDKDKDHTDTHAHTQHSDTHHADKDAKDKDSSKGGFLSSIFGSKDKDKDDVKDTHASSSSSSHHLPQPGVPGPYGVHSTVDSASMVPGRAGASHVTHGAIGLGAPTVTGDTMGLTDPNAIAEYNTNPPAKMAAEKKVDWVAHDAAAKAKQEATSSSSTSHNIPVSHTSSGTGSSSYHSNP